MGHSVYRETKCKLPVTQISLNCSVKISYFCSRDKEMQSEANDQWLCGAWSFRLADVFVLEDETTGYKGQFAEITIINEEKIVVLLEFVEITENFKISFILCSCTSHKKGSSLCVWVCACMCVLYICVCYVCICYGYVCICVVYACVLCEYTSCYVYVCIFVYTWVNVFVHMCIWCIVCICVHVEQYICPHHWFYAKTTYALCKICQFSVVHMNSNMNEIIKYSEGLPELFSLMDMFIIM